MNYDQEILCFLLEAGDEGISVKKLALHVQNACNNLFNVVNFDDVYVYVRQYLMRNSKNPNSVIERTDSRGIYRINKNVSEGQQLMLHFCSNMEEDLEDEKPDIDQSLSLF
ncbi:MAG: hypothetical protein KBA74_00345 [Prevotella sp.]|jgi:hypothetical protein|nr:hypothetical protein [Prevotella sp.]MBP7097121.1 hypothetical protein [Prevotella sp.]MBP8687195.1 hypothetical protein [Prevotella sp.]MBP8935699.1 hypothetical protein [Prevotella sp.]MBP9982512.1 hypothetical protein [Prevotella sp.]MCI1730895.1 hypothetical protein [Prevotella sp.]